MPARRSTISSRPIRCPVGRSETSTTTSPRRTTKAAPGRWWRRAHRLLSARSATARPRGYPREWTADAEPHPRNPVQLAAPTRDAEHALPQLGAVLVRLSLQHRGYRLAWRRSETVCQVDEANTVTQQRNQLFHRIIVPALRPPRCAHLPRYRLRHQPRAESRHQAIFRRIRLRRRHCRRQAARPTSTGAVRTVCAHAGRWRRGRRRGSRCGPTPGCGTRRRTRRAARRSGRPRTWRSPSRRRARRRRHRRCGGDAVDVGLHHDRVEGLVDAAARLEDGREKEPLRSLGIRTSTSPALVASSLGRVPLRSVRRSSVRSYRSAPIAPAASNSTSLEHGADRLADHVDAIAGTERLERSDRADWDKAIGGSPSVRDLVVSHRRSRRWPPTSRHHAGPQTPPLPGTLKRPRFDAAPV